MILPTSYNAAGSATATFARNAPSPSPTSPSSGISDEQWSSLIGIITAIVGNIMISFALNMQRYAHIRLEKEHQEKEKSRRRRTASYRSDQAKLGEDRGKANERRNFHPPRHTDYTVENERDSVDEGYIATESDPLIPSAAATNHHHSHSRSHHGRNSTDSEATVSDSSDIVSKQKSYLKSAYWWAGIILMTTGEAGNFLAYGFAPASIVSPLGVVGLISNCIIAPFMLKERFRRRDGFGVLVAVAGAVTVVASASDNNPKLGPGEIWDLISTWEFETYFGITVAIIIGLTVASNKFGEKNILIDLGLVGLYGGYTALSTKGVASMLSYTLWHALTFPVTYLLVAILVFTAIMQIKYVNRALQRFDATQVIPTQFVIFTLSVILGSAVLYRDFERTSSQDASKFVGGCALTFLGVYLITSGRPRNVDDEEDRDPEPPEAINLVDGERYRDDVDGAADETHGTSSRRSSTLRNASPPIPVRRRTSVQTPSQPSTPTRTLTQNNEGVQTPASPAPSSMNPPSPLTENPWEQFTSSSPSTRPTAHPTLSRHPTFSTPVLPSEPSPSTAGQSTSNPDLPVNPPATPTRNHSDHIVTPSASGTVPRLHRKNTIERLSARNSIHGPLFSSPLSTSMSAVVADLKRGGSLRGPSHLRDQNSDGARRRESVLGIGASEASAPVEEGAERRGTDGEVDAERGGRGRSLSGTLTDIWKGLRGGEGEEQQDVESGEGSRRR